MKRSRAASRSITYAGFLLATLLLAGAGIVAHRGQQLYQATVARESHTYLVLETATEFLNRLLQGESSIRGYVLTGERKQREDGLNSLVRARPLLDSLISLTHDNPAQEVRVRRLIPLTDHRITLIRELAALRDDAPGITSRMPVIISSGDAVMHLLRRDLSEFKGEEQRLLDERTAATVESGERALLAEVVAAGLAMLIILSALTTTFQELRERERAEEKLKLEAERQAVMIEMQQAIATAAVGDGMVMQLIVDQVVELTQSDGASISVVDGDHIRVTVAAGSLISQRGVDVPLAGTLSSEVVATGEPVTVEDVRNDPRTARFLGSTGDPRSLALLPIREQGRVKGILAMSSLRPRPLSTEDLQSLQLISGILSAGYTNAAAFEANERLMAQLRTSRDAAEDANRAKSAFLATMSHELRTPLNSVIGFANLLLRNRAQNLGEQDLQFLSRIRDNGTHLLNLINDVLDVSKIEAGRMEVHPVPTDLVPLVRETAAQLGGQAATREVELHTESPEGLVPVEVDPSRLRQVLINLIGNALKFTERGSVTVRVVAEIGGRPLRIDVIDTGVGIAEDRLDAIFEAFTQADATTERRFGGTGLGLTISRQILRLMGADLSVTSTLGKGSTFSVVFPASAARVAADLVRRELTPVPLPPPGPAPLILVVDDEADARTLLRSYLQEDGYRTAEATNGAEGLLHARAIKPALITLDLRMPGMNGLEFLRQLRSDPEIAGIPVLVISIEAAEHRGSLVGAVDVLAKPVDRNGLLSVIQRVLPIGRRKVLVVDDDIHTRQLFAAVLGAEGYQVRTARDGLEAFTGLEQEVPDLILLDLMMPVMDGGTFLAALRRNPRYASLPVAVVTALDIDSEAVRRLDGAAQAVVQKGPALERTLREVLQNVLGS
jgi:signal transduction histidine kinase/DNA-binding response OmpR family regulator/CHASE3 domain sensor protein